MTVSSANSAGYQTEQRLRDAYPGSGHVLQHQHRCVAQNGQRRYRCRLPSHRHRLHLLQRSGGRIRNERKDISRSDRQRRHVYHNKALEHISLKEKSDRRNKFGAQETGHQIYRLNAHQLADGVNIELLSSDVFSTLLSVTTRALTNTQRIVTMKLNPQMSITWRPGRLWKRLSKMGSSDRLASLTSIVSKSNAYWNMLRSNLPSIRLVIDLSESWTWRLQWSMTTDREPSASHSRRTH